MKLKPCPFCGSEKISKVRGPDYVAIVCNAIGCSAAVTAENYREATTKWNRRASQGG
jgi:Lar family restriction alleviation protein